MKLVIIGGNHGTGAVLAEQARLANHQVTIVSRSGSDAAHPQIVQVKADATDPLALAEALSGADAVVITVGGSKGVKLARTAVTGSVIQAMQTLQATAGNGPRRLLVQSSLGAGNSATQLPGAIGLITKVLLAAPLKDHNQQEQLVTGSGLDWSIVRPTGLSNKPATGKWTALQVDEVGKLGGSITRADLAAFMLATLEDAQSTGKAYGISN